MELGISPRMRAKSTVGGFAPWLTEEENLLRRNPVRYVARPPQTEDHLCAVLRSQERDVHLGCRFSAEFASAVYERTEGHQLFMCDMLRFLMDHEIVGHCGGSWQLSKPVSEIRRLIPSGVQQMIRLETSQIAEKDRKILECAAVQGVVFDSFVVSKALAIDAAETEETLGRFAAIHHFIECSGESTNPARPISVRFRFVHVLYQNSLYANIAPSRRASLSLSIAAALIDSEADSASGAAAEIAMLFECGRAGGPAQRAAGDPSGGSLSLSDLLIWEKSR